MFRDIEMEDLAATVFDDEEAIQDSKGEGWHGEEVHGRDDLAVIAKESRPALAGIIGRRQTPEISRDGAFRDLEAEFQKLTVNSWRAPEGIFVYHPANESSNLPIDHWPAHLLGARSQAPEQAKASSMPGDNRFWFDDDQWFALYKKLCRKWDPGRFLEICQRGVLQDWRLALPVIDDLIARKAFQDAVALANQAVGSMLRMTEGKAWDPRKGLILTESSFPYDGEKDRAIPGLLKRWNKAARAVGDNETACALELQLAILRDWTDGDAVLQALHHVPPCLDAIGERIYEDWRSLIAMWSVESAMDEFTGSERGWIHGLVDATRVGTKGPAMFRRVLLRWLDETGKTRTSLRRGFKSLVVLTLDLDSGSELKKASPALQRLLSREPEGDRRVTALRRAWLKRLRAGEQLPEVIQFWKRNAARLVPDPEHSAGDYRDCAEWLAVLRDIDPLACKMIVEQWKVTHRRRKTSGKLWSVPSLFRTEAMDGPVDGLPRLV